MIVVLCSLLHFSIQNYLVALFVANDTKLCLHFSCCLTVSCIEVVESNVGHYSYAEGAIELRASVAVIVL